MNVQLIVCDGVNSAGKPCGEIAMVIMARSMEQRLPDGRIVPATQYEIDCPACGRRTRVVTPVEDADA